MPALLEAPQCLGGHGGVGVVPERTQRADGQRHVVTDHPVVGHALHAGAAKPGEIAKRHIAERPLAGLAPKRRRLGRPHRQRPAQGFGDGAAQLRVGVKKALRVHLGVLVPQPGGARQAHQVGGEHGVVHRLGGNSLQGDNEGIQGAAIAFHQAGMGAGVQALQGVPAHERVAFVGGDALQLVQRVIGQQLDRRREAQQHAGQQRLVGIHLQGQCVTPHHDQFVAQRVGVRRQRHHLTAAVAQSQANRQGQRLLLGLARRGRGVLGEADDQPAAGGIPGAGQAQLRGAGLCVPRQEWRQVGARSGAQRAHEIFNGGRLAVLLGEVAPQPVAEGLCADHRVQHAHDLGAFFVDRRGVEIVDLLVGVGPHRVGGGAGVFRKLRGAQHAHLFDALHRAAKVVFAETLVTEHGEAFLQRQLEPVAAGHAVAGVVVEILVGDHRADGLKALVGGGVGGGQHVGGVEDVEALVLHRAHVEGAGGNDHVHVEVVDQPEALFVPAHGVFERGHGVSDAVLVAVVHEELERDVAAIGRAEGVGHLGQVPGHHGEQIAGLGVGIFPAGVVLTAGQRTALDAVAVGQQHRKARGVGLQTHGESRQHVGSVQIRRDA